MIAYFCTKTGARIAAPGVSKSVDPENGQDEFDESKPDKGSKKTTAPADAGSESKPDKGSK